MHSRPSVKCPAQLVGTPLQIVKLKRGGQGRISGSGPSGYKVNPAKLLSRSLAERTGANLAAKTRQEARIKAKAIPLKML
jgi:hypothetical protein